MEPVISAKIIKVIKATVVKGDGTAEDPIRAVAQYWTTEGRMIAEKEEGGNRHE